MHPLKQWQYNAIIICIFNSILHFCCTHIWYWFQCWFTGSIDSNFLFVLVRPRLILIWSFRPHWPSDKVRKFDWCNSECFIVFSDGDIFVKCPLSDVGQYCRGRQFWSFFLCNGTLSGIGAVYVHLVICWITSTTTGGKLFVSNPGRPWIPFSATSEAWCGLVSNIGRT